MELKIKKEWLRREIEREKGRKIEIDKIRSKDAENSRELMGKVKTKKQTKYGNGMEPTVVVGGGFTNTPTHNLSYNSTSYPFATWIEVDSTDDAHLALFTYSFNPLSTIFLQFLV